MAITHERSRPCQRNNTLATNQEDNEGTSLLHEHHLSLSYAGAADSYDGQRAKAEHRSSSFLTTTNINTQEEKEGEALSDMICDEFSQMMKLAIPVIGTYLFESLPGVVSIILVGHIQSDATKEYLDAAALATMFMNLTGVSIGLGLASAMDTLCSQAYGANESHRMGTFLQTGLIVLAATFVLVFFVSWYAAEILIALGQPEHISRLAGTFALYLVPGVPFLYLYELLRKIMQSQNKALPMLYVAAGANVVNVVLGYYLVYNNTREASEVWLGAAVARTACHVSFFVFMMLYLCATNSMTLFWSGWHVQEAWAGIADFVSLGVPGALQLCFEWWAFECLALLSGWLPDAQLSIGTNAILLNIASMVYMFYLGNSIACNTRIGNALGAGLPKRASVAAKLALGMATIMSLLLALVLLGFRSSLPLLFTHDAEIAQYCSTLLSIAAAFQLPDAINATVQGVFRGSGRQVLGAQLNFIAYYIVGIPVGILLAFHFQYQLAGLWIGLTAGLYVVATVGTFIILCRSDWQQLARDATRRLA